MKTRQTESRLGGLGKSSNSPNCDNINKILIAAMLLLSCGIFSCGTISTDSMLKDSWKLTTFPPNIKGEFTSGKASLAIKAGDGGIQKDSPRVRWTIFSAWQKLPSFVPGDRLLLSFETKSSAKNEKIISACLSGAPGAQPPCIRNFVHVGDVWGKTQLKLNTNGYVIKDTSVLEFIWEGALLPGETLEIRNISLEIDKDNTIPVFCITEPAGRVFMDGVFPDNRLSGRILPVRFHQGGDWTVRVVNIATPGKTLYMAKGKLLHPMTPWVIEGTKFEKGNYEAVLEIIPPDGQKKEIISDSFRKIDKSEVATYVKDKTFYYNGKPFVPIGLHHCNLWNMDVANDLNRRIGKKEFSYDELFKDIADHGFNCLHAHFFGDERFDEWAVFMKKHNMLMVPRLLPEIARKKVTEYSHFLGLFSFDEPRCDESYGNARREYATLKTLNPVQPLFGGVNQECILEDMDKTCQYVDVCVFGSYIVKSKTTDFSPLSKRMKSYAKMLADKPGIVFCFLPQAYIEVAEPSPAQLRVQTYMGLVHGTRAFFYYAYSEYYSRDTKGFEVYKIYYPETPTGMSLEPRRNKWWLPESLLWAEMKKLNSEITELTPYILSDSPSLGISGKNPKIDFASKSVDGKNYFIAVNITAEAQSAEFSFPFEAEMKGMFGTPDLKVVRGANMVKFKPYEVKVVCF